jgi:hypothetical protein
VITRLIVLARQNWPTVAAELLLPWLLASPAVLGYAEVRGAIANHIALVMTLGALIILAAVLQAANGVCALLGTWLAVSPWIIGYASISTPAAVNDLLTGVLLVALCAIQHQRLERRSSPQLSSW